jgi:hypothetical protein
MSNMKGIHFDIQNSIFNIQYFLVLRHSDGVAAELKIIVVNILS